MATPVRTQSSSDRDEALRRSPPWLAMGFRPFFLAAAAFAVLGTAAWLHVLIGGGPVGDGRLRPSLWHAHEMLFGLALAVVAGFLLTAVRNWSGRDTLHGWPLLGLVLLWVAGRLSMSPLLAAPAWVAAVLGVAFPVLLAGVLGRVLVQAGSRRNYGIVVVLGALTIAALLVHLEALGLAPGAAAPGIHAALHLVVLLVVVIGGRVIPLFTRNRTGAETRRIPALDRTAIGAAAAVALLATAQSTPFAPRWTPEALAVVAGISGLLQLGRMSTWGVGAGLRVPMLRVLHVGYAWIGCGHLLLAWALFTDGFPFTVALHALTIGVIGTMTVGMMARVSMGHTGRAIRATGLVRGAFLAVSVATLARLSAAVVPPTHLVDSWVLSGGLFALAYALYLIAAWRWLVRIRPDGRPG